jgi:BlaI family transcriptional regulator, penicillinase repressor
MTSGKKLTLTDLELEIMKVIWDREPCTVREVYEELLEKKKIAYTTVMTMMKILEEKGHLKKNAEGRAFVYRSAHPQKKVVTTMVNDLVARLFDGSAKPLVLNLIKDRKLSKKDLEEIARALEGSE